MTFLPIDTGSSTHKRLTEAILRGNMKKCSIVEFVNVEDPEKVKREAERVISYHRNILWLILLLD